MKHLKLFFQKSAIVGRGAKFKEWNGKNRIENFSFFNEISLEYKETKLPQDYMEKGKSQISLTDNLKMHF